MTTNGTTMKITPGICPPVERRCTLIGNRLLHGHAALVAPQAVAIVIEDGDGRRHEVSQRDFDRALAGDEVYVGGGLLRISLRLATEEDERAADAKIEHENKQ
jgi:hypothetical protein